VQQKLNLILPGLRVIQVQNQFYEVFYHKLLKEISRDSIRVGIGYDFQLLDLVPHSDFDEPVQFVVTETQLLRCRNV